MEQMSIETVKAYDPYIDDVKVALTEAIADTDFASFLSVERLKGGEVSIKAKSSIVAKLFFRKKTKSYMMIRVGGLKYFDGLETIIDSAEDEWFKISFNSVSDVIAIAPQLAQVFMKIMKDFEHESFGCCSRYMECSDAKKCVHPNKIKAEACQYKTNLEHGLIFYGKNRNID